MSILCMFTVQQSTGMNVLSLGHHNVSYFLDGMATNPASASYTNLTTRIALRQADCVAVIVVVVAAAAVDVFGNLPTA